MGRELAFREKLYILCVGFPAEDSSFFMICSGNYFEYSKIFFTLAPTPTPISCHPNLPPVVFLRNLCFDIDLLVKKWKKEVSAQYQSYNRLMKLFDQ